MAAQASNEVALELSSYCAFSVGSILGAATVPGSSHHDGVNDSMRPAMSSWYSLVSSDAAAVATTGAAFKGIDSSLARNLL